MIQKKGEIQLSIAFFYFFYFGVRFLLLILVQATGDIGGKMS